MSSIDEVKKIEAQMINAELGPDPKFFEMILHDDAILDGIRNKARVVAAHQPGAGPKFTKVSMTGYNYVDQGDAVVVTCKGEYESEKWSGALQFMRVWLKKNNQWQVIAGSTLHLTDEK